MIRNTDQISQARLEHQVEMTAKNYIAADYDDPGVLAVLHLGCLPSKENEKLTQSRTARSHAGLLKSGQKIKQHLYKPQPKVWLPPQIQKSREEEVEEGYYALTT